MPSTAAAPAKACGHGCLHGTVDAAAIVLGCAFECGWTGFCDAVRWRCGWQCGTCSRASPSFSASAAAAWAALLSPRLIALSTAAVSSLIFISMRDSTAAMSFFTACITGGPLLFGHKAGET